METPLYTLTAKEFLSGISMGGAHTEGGLFYKAAGVTPLFDAGAAQSVNNGLLMAGAQAVSVGATTGSIISSIQDGAIYNTTGAIFGTSSSHIYKLLFAGGVPSGVPGDQHTCSEQLTSGMVIFKDSGGNNYLFYRTVGHMGRTDGTSYNDTWQALNTDYFGATFVHFGLNKIFTGNGAGKLASIDSALSVTTSALTFDGGSFCSAIADDGVYVVLAITRNTSADSTYLAESHILYWNGSSTTGYLRDYAITDPFIYSIQKTPVGVFAFGLTGIWQVTFDGIQKIFSHSPGVYTATGASAIHYGRGATSFFSDALLWGGASGTNEVIKTLGKLDAAASNAYLQPILATAGKNITRVDGQLLKGIVFVADDTPTLNYFTIGSGTPQTGVSAQTIYLKPPAPINITHIDVIFGEPLASGDTLDLDVFRDEDTTATDFGNVSYSPNQNIRRNQFTNTKAARLNVENQFSILLTFTAGSPKVKAIEVFGTPVDRKDA